MVRTRRGSVGSARVGELWIFVMPDRPVDDALWREHLENCAAEVRRNGPYAGVLGWAAKNGPSAAQRRIMTVEYADRLRLDKQRRFALITESALVRGIMTALGWVSPGTKMNAFAPSDVDRAFDWIAEDGIVFDRKQAEEALRSLRLEVAQPRSAAGY